MSESLRSRLFRVVVILSPVALVLAILLPVWANAASPLEIDYASSHIRFVFRQMNVPVEGSFSRFRATITFDSRRPERSRAAFELDLTSIDSGSADGDTEIRRRVWLDTEHFPSARFDSTGVRRLSPTGSGQRYLITGRMRIKGHENVLAIPVTVRPQGGRQIFEGEFPLRRLLYSIGEGVWADTDTVADEVVVHFVITTHARKTP